MWYRITTVRWDRVLTSDLSFDLARRLVPKLLTRHGVKDTVGVFTGRYFPIHK